MIQGTIEIATLISVLLFWISQMMKERIRTRKQEDKEDEMMLSVVKQNNILMGRLVEVMEALVNGKSSN